MPAAEWHGYSVHCPMENYRGFVTRVGHRPVNPKPARTDNGHTDISVAWKKFSEPGNACPA
jgi:hypothetical protein